MQFTKSILRQFKRHLHVDDAEVFLQGLTKEDAATDILALKTNLPAFFQSVNLAYVDYDDKLRLASRSLEISSMELNAANRKLEQLVSSMNAMMDGLGQGLLFFDRNGTCSNVFSKICLEFFKTSPEGKNIADLLDLNEQDKTDLALWLDAIFDAGSAMDIEDLYDMAPQNFSKDGRILRLEYRAMKDNRGKLIGVLMISTDITKEITYNASRADLEDQAARIVAIAGNRNNFLDFLVEMEDFTRHELKDLWHESPETLALRLHTYKGLASSFYFSRLAQQLHELETLLSKGKTVSLAQKDDQLTSVTRYLTEARELGEKLFGEGFYQNGKTKMVSTASLEKLADMLERCDEGVKQYFDQEFMGLSPEEALQPFIAEVKRLSAVQQKTSPAISVESSGITLKPEKYKKLLNSFIHIARNMVDHGLELPAERIAEGKPPEGRITVVWKKTAENIVIEFSDDGAGIDEQKLWAAIDKIQQSSNTWSADNILESVFLPDISTSQETTVVSGRGIGLAAVKAEVESLSGSISITSRKSHGTSIIITIPDYHVD